MKKGIIVFKALSDINRIRILKMLFIRPLCVCEVKAILELANSTVSKHLSILRNAGLIKDEKEGKWVNYYLNFDLNDEYGRHLLPMIQSWFLNDDLLKADHKKVKNVDRNKLCNT